MASTSSLTADTQTSRLTVADALELPELRRALPEVVAGKEGLRTVVRWAHAGEVSDMASLLQGGELLLTTGMGLGRRAVEQRRFIAELAEKKVAALVIELGRTLNEIPDALVKSAEAHQLPLISLRRDIPFVTVTEAIHTRIIGSRYQLLRQGDEIHNELTHILLDGGGIPEVLQRVSELVANPVFLEDVEGRLLYHAALGDEQETLAAWQASKGSVNSGSWSGAVAEPVSGGRRGPRGRLLALPLAAPLGDDAQTVINRAADVIAVSLLRARQEEELQARERGDLLSDLVDGRLSGKSAASSADALGFTSRGGLLLPVAAVVDTTATHGQWGVAMRDVHSDLEGRGYKALIGVGRRSTALLALVAVRDEGQRDVVAGVTAAAIRAGVERRVGGARVTVAVGDICGWPRVGPMLASAVEGALSAVDLPEIPWHGARTLELQRLLWHARNDQHLQGFVERVLGPLIAHDRSRKHSLLPTLEALCSHGGHKAETARALHLNRQALYNRLTRIEELLGANLSDSDEMLTLHLACRARGVLQSAGLL